MKVSLSRPQLELRLTISIDGARCHIAPESVASSREAAEALDNAEREVRVQRQQAEIDTMVRERHLQTVIVLFELALRQRLRPRDRCSLL